MAKATAIFRGRLRGRSPESLDRATFGALAYDYAQNDGRPELTEWQGEILR